MSATAPPKPRVSTPLDDPEALIEEARRRARRRWTLTGVLAMAALIGAGVGGYFIGHGGGPPNVRNGSGGGAGGSGSHGSGGSSGSQAGGSPAPPNVKADFRSYATQLGFNPQPGKAVLVARDGDYQLYATTNKQGGSCILVSAPWKRPGPHGEGGDCSSRQQAAVAFWAGMGGIAGAPHGGTRLVIDGRTREAKAASIRFATPVQKTLSVPVGSSGFFIFGITTHASWCQIVGWNPRATILDSNGHELTTEPMRIGRNLVCLSKPRPTVTTEHGHKVFTLRTTDNDRPTGYIAGARLGDRITCRLADTTVTLAVPIHRAHTVSPVGQAQSLELDVAHTRDGRVWVSCQ